MYDIKNDDGTISRQKPVNGAWYCHFTIKPDGFHSDGNIGQCHYVDDKSIEFIDENGETVDMVSDYFPCYLVRQI